jgi:hypothetical protein
MYYPYLRGKQFELILLRDNAEIIAHNKIHPIIEPVKKDFKSLNRAIEVIEEKNINYTLIINPITGEKPVTLISIMENFIKNSNNIDFQNLSLGYILSAESDIEEFIKLLENNEDKNFSIIHYGYPNSKIIAEKTIDFDNIQRHIFIDGFAGKLYQRNLKKDGIERILIRDGFKTQPKNSLYPESEHFSDLHITYPDEGMDGFGDFLTVGTDYSETGGPAYAVAIHLTYLNEEDDMFIFHFISDRTDSPTDPGGKFLEALSKLVETAENEHTLIFKSEAYHEFKNLFDKQHYPGLGYAKKLSMQHHLELIVNFLNQV